MEMRRKDRELTDAEALSIIENGEYGVLSTVDKDGLPYGVPVNFALKDNKIYIHCAKAESHKLNNIRQNSKCCFTVIGSTEVMPEKFATKYLSGIAFGNIKIVTDEDLKTEGLIYILQKYSPEFMESGKKYIEASINDVELLEFEIQEFSGKGRKK